MQLYQNISRICREKNISIAKLEREMGIANGTLNRWSTIKPSIYAVADVADHLGVSIDELCGRESTDAMMQTAINYVQKHNNLSRDEDMFLIMLRTMTEEQKKEWFYDGVKIKCRGDNETR